jgi:hypothetical protein
MNGADQLKWHSHPIIQDSDGQCADLEQEKFETLISRGVFFKVRRLRMVNGESRRRPPLLAL